MQVLKFDFVPNFRIGGNMCSAFRLWKILEARNGRIFANKKVLIEDLVNDIKVTS